MNYDELIKKLDSLIHTPSIIPDKICKESSLLKELDRAETTIEQTHMAIDLYLKSAALSNEDLTNYCLIVSQFMTLQHTIKKLSTKLKVLSEQFETGVITPEDFQKNCQKAIDLDALKYPNMSWLKKNHPIPFDTATLTRKIDFNFVVLTLPETLKKNEMVRSKSSVESLQTFLNLYFADYQDHNYFETFKRRCKEVISRWISEDGSIKKEQMAEKIQNITTLVVESVSGSKHSIVDQDDWLIALREGQAKKQFLKQLDYLADKASGWHERHEDEAALAAIKLCKRLLHGYLFYIKDEKNNSGYFREWCTTAFNEARPVLEKHRFLLNKILINLALAIVGLGIGFVIAGLINLAVTDGKHFLFFKTDSENTMDAMEDNINGMMTTA